MTSGPQDIEGQLAISGLPRAIIDHLMLCISKRKLHRWHDALAADFDSVLTSTRQLIDRCCQITGRDQDSLIQDTDFDSKDLDADRLDAAIAELRGLVHLSNEGFFNVKLLRAQPGTRTADIVADRNSRRYALDIACSSANTARDVSSLARYMIHVCQSKAQQLASTKTAENCQSTGVVFVINSQPALVWGYQPLFRTAIQDALRALGEPLDYHITILTGRVAYTAGFEGPDDVVHPRWID